MGQIFEGATIIGDSALKSVSGKKQQKKDTGTSWDRIESTKM